MRSDYASQIYMGLKSASLVLISTSVSNALFKACSIIARANDFIAYSSSRNTLYSSYHWPLFTELTNLVLTILATSTSLEASFSGLSRMKTYLKSFQT